MAAPTVAERMKRKYVVMTTDQDMIERLGEATPPEWTQVVCTNFEDLGEWGDVLLYRFILLDLDEWEVFDPLDVIRMLRMQYQINTPVFCFGGDEDIQDEMRLARADRFFGREEMAERLPDFLQQYAWGE